jgi:hypothetical protein
MFETIGALQTTTTPWRIGCRCDRPDRASVADAIRRKPSAHPAWSTSPVRGGHRMGTVVAGCRVVKLGLPRPPRGRPRYYPALSGDIFPSCGCHAIRACPDPLTPLAQRRMGGVDGISPIDKLITVARNVCR